MSLSQGVRWTGRGGRLLYRGSRHGRLAELESRLRAGAPSPDLTTLEPAMQRAYEILFKAASTPSTILLAGESGTGKTVVALAIHDRSARVGEAKRRSAHVRLIAATNRDLEEAVTAGRMRADPGR